MIIELMATQLALPASFLVKLASTASHRYKRYEIPKRTGGMRTIYHPARELKLVQGWLSKNVLIGLPVHAAATAYEEGSSIKRNAEQHVNNNYLLRIDFQDFFPSLRGTDVEAVLRANRKTLAAAEISEQDISFIKKIVCRYDRSKAHYFLTIGAPTSPHLSNAIMFDFDEIWTQNAKALEVTYTRYADDLYFSTNRPNVLRDILSALRNTLNAGVRPALRINESKTAFSSRKRRRLVAGLVLTSDRKISIGRSKKRVLKSLVMKLKNHQLEREEVAKLRGWVSYLRFVEPSFLSTLQQKYKLDFDSPLTWDF